MTEIVSPRPLAIDAEAGSAVTWSAIIAGGVAAAALTFVLVLLGAGIGLSIAPPWTLKAGAAVGVGSIIWLIVTEWIAAAVGGYLTGRLRSRWVGIHTHEVFFRDTAHGFLAWCLGVVVAGAIFALTGVAVVGGVGSAATEVASGAVTGAASGATAAATGVPRGAIAYFGDLLFRKAPPSATTEARAATTDSAAPTDSGVTAPATGTTASDTGTAAPAAVPSSDAASAAPAMTPQGNGATRDEGVRILANGIAAGSLSADDKAYLASLIAANSSIPQAEAEKRVDAVWTQVEAAKQKAADAADAARKAGATLALFGFLSLLIGAFIASVAAAFGGNERDEIETRYRAM